jgi:glutathione synthase
MRIAIIGDEPKELKVSMDTTLLIAAESNRREHEVFYSTPRQLYLSSSGACAQWSRFNYKLNDARSPEQCLEEAFDAPTSAFDIVLMRQDPPVSEKYVSVAHILDFSTTPVLNNPRDVICFNEKASVLHLKEFSPPSIVSIDPDRIISFVNQFEHGCVLKPLNLFNGRGVVRLTPGYEDLYNLIELGTEQFTKFVIVQEFVPAVSSGDKRVFLLDGRPIGRMNRVPAPGEWRANIHLGAQPQTFDLSPRDLEIVEAVAKLLAKYDIPIACIDIIGNFLTEINVTSPSGIPEINRIHGDGHERPIVDYLESRAAATKQQGHGSH